jgi:uncharacterized protein (UPF0335 family)
MEGRNDIDTTLESCITRLEHIDERRKELNGEAGEIYTELRDAGYNVKAARRIVSERRMDRDALAALNETLDDYRRKLGMLADTPLGEAAMPRPVPFAEQPVSRRGRPRKNAAQRAEEHLANARAHLGFNDDQPPAA